MNSIEVNSSFYKIPQASTVKRWTEDVPEYFKFTFKLFKGITHHKGLVFDLLEIKHFMQVISFAGIKSGCLLIQFPPSVHSGHLNQLQLLMEAIRNADHLMQWKIALEFRHSSLYNQDVYDLLETYKMAMVIHDKASANSPLMETHSDFIYLRFHGPGGNYRGSYQADVLYEYATYITDWIAEGKQVYVYFNNTMGEALKNLSLLSQQVKNSF